MTYHVVLTVEQSQNAVKSPTGAAAGKMRFSLVDATNSPIGSQEVDGLTATFADLPTGTFTATAQQLDVNGSPIGDPVTASFRDGDTAPADVTFNPPSALTAQVTNDDGQPAQQ